MMLDFVADFRNATRALLKLNKGLDADKVADDAAAIILGRIRKRYLNETGPDGQKWVKSYAALRRAKRGRGGGTLFDTGKLFHSIQAVKKGAGLRSIQTDVPYAIEHHRGIGQLARPFLDTNEDDMQFITDFIIRRLR